MADRWKKGSVGIVACILAVALCSCSVPQDAQTPKPSPIAGTGTALDAGATEPQATDTTEPSSTTETSATEPKEPTLPTKPDDVDMTEEEWEDYISEDPLAQRPQTPEAPPEDTLPSAAPPPKPTTTTTEATTTTTTTTSSTTTTSGTTSPGTTTSGTTASGTTTSGTTASGTTSSGTTASGATDGSDTSQTSTSTGTSTSSTQAPPQDGWYVNDGKTYYYYEGKPVTGYQTMGGIRYYFDADGVLSSKVGIDVSTFQGTIDWNKVKAAGIDFALIRVGYRGYGTAKLMMDVYFERNLQGATAAGIDCGVYFFTQAITEAEAREEAQYTLKAIQGYKVSYPVIIDTEYITTNDGVPRANGLSASVRTNVVNAFCDEVRKAGYYPMVYADKNWLTNHLESERLTADVWLAQYNSTVTYAGEYKIWQYTSAGRVNGISTAVDMNVGLVDYAAYLRENGWNHL